jgi:galactose mutarotase-like enzyme
MARLRTLNAGELEATFVPEAGMVGCSLTHRGEELLGQRGGLESYIAERKTMGIPFLHPWANRLSPPRFTLAGREVRIDPTHTRRDDNGLPMHGLLAAAPGWRVTHHDDTHLTATFDFALESFPFPHTIQLDAALTPQAPFALESPDRRIELAFHEGFPYSQVFAPPGEQLVAFEPMTAPTNALVTGQDLSFADHYRAEFSIRVR